VEPPGPPVAAAPVALHQRQRPLWLVALLTITTFGGYTPIWLGVTWAEMKKALNDDDMHPVWHALATLVPIYGLIKFCDHYTVVESFAARAGHRMRLSAFAATVVALFTTVPGGSDRTFPTVVAILILVLWIVAACGRAWVLVEGQAALNAYWRSVPNDAPGARIAWWEWLLVAVGVGWFLLVAVGLFLPEPSTGGPMARR
jgi:hypothetical protein